LVQGIARIIIILDHFCSPMTSKNYINDIRIGGQNHRNVLGPVSPTSAPAVGIRRATASLDFQDMATDTQGARVMFHR
jgi:hypothetical protein